MNSHWKSTMGQALGRGEELVLGGGNSCGGKTVNQAENKLMRPKFESDTDHWVTLHSVSGPQFPQFLALV